MLLQVCGQQGCYKYDTASLLQAYRQQACQPVQTHLVDKLLMQTCFKSAAGLLQLVRFYVCTRHARNARDFFSFLSGGRGVSIIFANEYWWAVALWHTASNIQHFMNN